MAATLGAQTRRHAPSQNNRGGGPIVVCAYPQGGISAVTGTLSAWVIAFLRDCAVRASLMCFRLIFRLAGVEDPACHISCLIKAISLFGRLGCITIRACAKLGFFVVADGSVKSKNMQIF